MSRIEDAFKRMTGGSSPAEPRPTATLDHFTGEHASKPAEKITPFATVTLFGSEGKGAVNLSKIAPPPPITAPKTNGRTATVNVDPKPPSATVDPIADATAGHDTSESDAILDVRQFVDYARFVFGAAGRHKALALGTLVLCLGMTAALLKVLPRTYHVQVKLLAQKNEVMTALSNPGRAVPWDADAPTRAAAETVLRRDNLVSLIQQTNLLENWDRTRAPILKLKDALEAITRRHPASAEERLDRLVGTLEARMAVQAGQTGDGTVTIDLEWPDPQMAYRLVGLAQDAFLAARERSETATIAESISILERYSQTLHDDIDRTMAELQRTQGARRPSAPRVASVRKPLLAPVTSLLPPVPAVALGDPAMGAGLDDPEIPRLKADIESKKQEIKAVEDGRQRQLSGLQARLAQLMTIYTPTHPSVQAVQQNIASLSHEPPQLASLKNQLDGIQTDYDKRVAAVTELQQAEQLKTDSARRAAQTADTASLPAATPAPPTIEPAATPESPDFNSVRLRLELNQLESVLERTDGARIELAVSQAAFKYRYTVIRPAQVPRDPVRPNVAMVLIAGFAASIVLALIAVVGKDVLSDRVLEQWQVERQLGLPILAALGTS
jgi:uncharacterized protein involved in exopolysaccharide biosynthesis